MNNVEKREKFLKDFKKQHPGYEIVEFKNNSSPMTIKDAHGFLYRKKCALRFLTHNISVDSLVDKEAYVRHILKLKHPEYELINFYNFSDKGFIIQDINGFQYKVRWYDFIVKNHPVSIKSCTDKYKYFVFNSNIKHDNKYEYPFFEYKTGRDDITILCPIHGEFKQKIERHLYGNGCPKCNRGGFSKEQYCTQNSGKQGSLYVLELSNKEESFLKIGISIKDLKIRYGSSKLTNNYNIDEKHVFNMEACDSKILEDKLIKEFKEYKYLPLIDFGGKTECFKKECLNELIKTINYAHMGDF